MDSRTRSYVMGRFRDHYRRAEVASPPAAARREWAYIPWRGGEGTAMVRHRSLRDLGDLRTFLSEEHPRHVYHSAGRYGDPAAGAMAAKDWQGADLVFDLDADHLPDVTPETSYPEMLERCKAELYDLLGLLESDFGFEDLEVVFSGNRGYHVHVRREDARGLDREARREIADYVRGEAVELSGLVEHERSHGEFGRQTPADRRRLSTDRGWGSRIHDALLSTIEELTAMSEPDAIERLRGYEGIGEQRARGIYDAIRRAREEIDRGNIDIHPAFPRYVEVIAREATRRHGAAIDEPVTTDINRLIRLPGSIHGGSGLVVRPIPRDRLDLFEPLEHAIPATFRGQEIAIKLEEPTTVSLGGANYELDAGIESVPEFVGIHLLVTDRARKVPEPSR